MGVGFRVPPSGQTVRRLDRGITRVASEIGRSSAPALTVGIPSVTSYPGVASARCLPFQERRGEEEVHASLSKGAHCQGYRQSVSTVHLNTAMYRRSDPRFRRTLNEISQTIESANESAQENIFTFSHRYLTPCFSSVSAFFHSCADACFPPRDQRTRRRGRSYGRAELNFDFYDDWDDDENDALLGWGNDGFDRLLAGSGNTNTQPGRQRGMSYGTRRDKSGRRKSAVQPHDGGADPTIIPSTSYFGFLGKLTGKVGGKKGLRYKPSAADLQEHPGASRKTIPEGEPLFEDSDENGSEARRKHRRNRSGTATSGDTTDSLSSRGDIFPSEDELDDAVPLDDEFAMVLERRTTGSGLNDESSSGRGKRGKRPNAGSRMSTRTMSSRSTRTSHRASRATSGSPTPERIIDGDANTVPSLTELKQEEERAQQEEEADIARRREAAKRLALERGLSTSDHPAVCDSILSE